MHTGLGCGDMRCCSGKCADKALLVLRLAAGAIFLYHGYGKLFGMPGIAGTTAFFTMLHIPLASIAAWVVALVEFVGGIALVLGVLVQPVAILLAVDMLVAFFAASKGRLPHGDLEFALFAVVLALALAGGGCFALMRPKRDDAPSGQ